MPIQALLQNKDILPKDKTGQLAAWLLNGTVTQAELLAVASTGKPPILATCIESLEFATQSRPDLITPETLAFVIGCLNHKAPRVKWEAAKVVGNTIQLFPDALENALQGLLKNTTDPGTVVRWSAAFGISQIILMKTALNTDLLPAAAAIMNNEVKNSIKKIYAGTFKKVGYGFRVITEG